MSRAGSVFSKKKEISVGSGTKHQARCKKGLKQV